MLRLSFLVVSLMTVIGLSVVSAQQPATPPVAQEPTPYGSPINLEMARKILAAAEQEAVQQKWPVAITIVDNAGYLVAFQRLDNTQYGSVEVSIEKAKTAALFRRPTKVFEDIVAQGGAGLRILKLPGALPVEGGLPIVHDGRVIGGIGVSGVTSVQDGLVAKAGLSVLEAK